MPPRESELEMEPRPLNILRAWRWWTAGWRRRWPHPVMPEGRKI